MKIKQSSHVVRLLISNSSSSSVSISCGTNTSNVTCSWWPIEGHSVFHRAIFTKSTVQKHRHFPRFPEALTQNKFDGSAKNVCKQLKRYIILYGVFSLPGWRKWPHFWVKMELVRATEKRQSEKYVCDSDGSEALFNVNNKCMPVCVRM